MHDIVDDMVHALVHDIVDDIVDALVHDIVHAPVHAFVHAPVHDKPLKPLIHDVLGQVFPVLCFVFLLFFLFF